MSVNEFSQKVQAIIASAASLKQQLEQSPLSANELMQSAFDELYTALEELQVAEEELHQQNEELGLATHVTQIERQRYQDLFESAPDSYLVTDEYSTIRQSNHAASHMLNIEAKHLKGKSLVVFVAPEDRPEFRRKLVMLSQMNEPQEWETRLQPRHEQPIDVIVSVTVVRDEINPSQITLRWLLHDITLQKEYQEQLRVLNAELEQRVSDRTAQLEESIRIRDEFLSIAAHELRTPVTSLHGFIQLMLRQLDKETPLDPEAARRHLQIMDRQSTKLTRLIAQLLDVSRLEAGRLSLELQRTDIAKLTRDLVEQAQRNTTEHTLTVNAPPSYMSLIDPIRLEQVIVNLLNNAIKYSPEGGQISVDLSAADDQTIQLSVTDQGMGIAPEDREHIFERFYQGHKDQNIDGMGLGLYISKQIVQLHGGHLRAEFPPEGGTRLIVHLPFYAEDPPTPAQV